MARRPRVLLGAILAAFACEVEEPSTLEVAVRVDPPVEAASFPAQVLVRLDSDGSGVVVFRVGFLCAPDARFSTTAVFEARGRDAPTTADAFLVPVEGGAVFACGPLATPQAVPFTGAPRGFAHTTARFQVLAGCGSGDVRSATLVLAPSP